MDLITTPAVVGQSPPANSIVHSTSVSLTDRRPIEPVHLVQYDDTLPIVAVALTANDNPYTVPSGAAVNVRLAKPGGTYVYNPAYGVSSDGQTVYIAITVQMTVVAGKISPIVEIVVNGAVAGTGFFVLDIDPNPIPEDAIESTDEYQTIQQLAAEVTQAAQVITDNMEGIQYVQQNSAALTAVAQNASNISAVGGSIDNVNAVAGSLAPIQTAATNIAAIQQAPAAATNAGASATLAESWAVGGTGTRSGEDTNNAKYYALLAQSLASDSYTKQEADELFVQSASLLDIVYPVGSVYISTSNVSPQSFMGGTWQQIQDTFLMAAGNTYPAGQTGGSSTHALSQDELPDVDLPVSTVVRTGQTANSSDWGDTGNRIVTNGGASTTTIDTLASVSLGGSGTPFNTLPPYLSVYMWKRTA